LIDSSPDEAWDHQKTDSLYRRVSKVEVEPEADPLLQQERHLEEKLEHPPGKNTRRQRHDRPFKDMIKKEDRNDDGYIEKDRSERRRKEMPKRVQNSHAEGKEPHEKEVGEHDSIKCNDKSKF